MVNVLRVDLSTRTTREETLPEELTRELIGAKGIASLVLRQEVAPGIDPLHQVRRQGHVPFIP